MPLTPLDPRRWTRFAERRTPPGKGQSRSFKQRGLAGVLLPVPDNDVAFERCIATGEAVRPKEPQIAGPRNGRPAQAVGRKFVLGGGLLCLLFGCLVQHEVDLAERKPGQFDVVELKVEEPLQFGRQQRAVPTRQFGQPIIGYDVGAPVGRGEIGQPNRRHLPQAEELCGLTRP